MLLGNYTLAQGDVRRYTVDYSEFLDKGTTLVSPVVAVATAGVASTAGSPSFNPSDTKLHFYVTAGAVNETFMVGVQVQTTDTELIHDTVKFTVVAP